MTEHPWRTRSILLALWLITAPAICPQRALAQTPDRAPSEGGLEEIVVTATRRAGILRVLRREGAREIPTAVAAWLSMAAIVYVAVEVFRSPVDAGTKYLPYLAAVSIATVALVFLVTRRDAIVSEGEVE